MSANRGEPGAQDREPRADECLAARRADQPGGRGSSSPFARARGTDGSQPRTQTSPMVPGGTSPSWASSILTSTP